MSGWVPVALACGHLVEDQAVYQMPAEGSGEPELVECPEGCGMVEYILPPEFQGRPRGQFVEVDLGYLNAGDAIELDLEDDT